MNNIYFQENKSKLQKKYMYTKWEQALTQGQFMKNCPGGYLKKHQQLTDK